MTNKNVITSKTKRLLNNVLRELRAGGRSFQPLYPYVLVRVLPKEQTIKGFIIPDTAAHNKPVYEGVVLCTWKPWFKCIKGTGEDCRMLQTVLIESQLKPGNVIVFQHFEGVPVPFDEFEGDYRLIPEIGDGKGRSGIPAVLEFDDAQDPVDTVVKAMWERAPKFNEKHEATLVQILSGYDLIPKQINPMTTSGADNELAIQK